MTRMRKTLALNLVGSRQHLVGCGDNLGIHFIGPLRNDQGGDLADRVDIGGLGVALEQGANAAPDAPL
jgi:hypothetical protein